MICAKCKYPELRVVYTIPRDFKQLIERRRECVKCGHRMTTYERPRDETTSKTTRR